VRAAGQVTVTATVGVATVSKQSTVAFPDQAYRMTVPDRQVIS
jgi:hypothetical protein